MRSAFKNKLSRHPGAIRRGGHFQQEIDLTVQVIRFVLDSKRPGRSGHNGQNESDFPIRTRTLSALAAIPRARSRNEGSGPENFQHIPGLFRAFRCSSFFSFLTLNTALPYHRLMFPIVESSLFSRLVFDYLSEEEYEGLKLFLVLNPESGDMIPGSGGLRKLRWIRTGTGKRGGVRVIYFLRTSRGEIALLTLYSKSKVGNLPPPYREAIEGGV